MTDDRVFGPLVTFGLGDTEVPADQAARLTPLTDTDADALIGSLRAAPLLRELLLRVSRLADDLPEIAELDLSPVIARVKVTPCAPHDPFLRKLR